MRYFYSLALATFFLGATPATAVSPQGNSWYGSAFVGAVAFTHEKSVIYPDNLGLKFEPSAGFYIGGAVGGWLNEALRLEVAVGFRSYEADVLITQARSSTDISTITVMVNNYFYPVYLFDVETKLARHFYVGTGVGVGLWSFDGGSSTRYQDEYETFSAVLQASAGYEFYLVDLRDFGVDIPDTISSLSVGIKYQFMYSAPKPTFDVVDSAGTVTARYTNQRLHQISHGVLFNARWGF